MIIYDDLLKLFCYDNMFVMCDLNCRMYEWNCLSENTNGKVLLNLCIDLNIEISAPLSYTNFPPRGNPSIIDLYLFKNKINHSIPKTIQQHNSNHNPVELEIMSEYKKVNTANIYDYEKANSINFRKEVSHGIDLNFYIVNREKVENKLEIFIKGGHHPRIFQNSIFLLHFLTAIVIKYQYAKGFLNILFRFRDINL